MTFLDIAIVYFSLGAPFGVYGFFRQGEPVRLAGTLKAIGTFLLWPPFAVTALIRGFYRVRSNEQFAQIYRLDEGVHEKARFILKELKPKLRRLSGNEAARIFETVERYAELSLLSKTYSGSESGHFMNLLVASGHQNAKTGAICLERRNQRNLKKHQMAAREELIEAVRSAATEIIFLRNAIIQIADLLGDDEMIESLTEQNRSGSVKVSDTTSTRGNAWRTIEVQSLKTVARPEN